MRTPATFGRYLFAVLRTYWSFQGVLLGVILLYVVLGGKSGRFDPNVSVPYLTSSVAGLAGIAFVLWIQYRRGDLDTYEIRRRTQPAEG